MTAADFRSHIGDALDAVQREPVTITSRARARAVVVTPEFYERAIEALEDQDDVEFSRASRDEVGPTISLDALRAELGFKVRPGAGTTLN